VNSKVVNNANYTIEGFSIEGQYPPEKVTLTCCHHKIRSNFGSPRTRDQLPWPAYVLWNIIHMRVRSIVQIMIEDMNLKGTSRRPFLWTFKFYYPYLIKSVSACLEFLYEWNLRKIKHFHFKSDLLGNNYTRVKFIQCIGTNQQNSQLSIFSF